MTNKLSMGQLLANMHRCGPNSSMQVSTQRRTESVKKLGTAPLESAEILHTTLPAAARRPSADLHASSYNQNLWMRHRFEDATYLPH